jgi:hypothetical protein
MNVFYHSTLKTKTIGVFNYFRLCRFAIDNDYRIVVMLGIGDADSSGVRQQVLQINKARCCSHKPRWKLMVSISITPILKRSM